MNKCKKCVCKDFYERLEQGYEIVGKDKRVDGMEIMQYNKKGKLVKWTFVNYPPKGGK